MNIFTLIGSITITAALLAYSVAIITEQVKKKINKVVLFHLSLAVFLDITATACMIIGSSNSAFTLHGAIGYSALFAMLIDLYLIWKNYLKFGEKVSKSVHLYTLIAYIWWIVAYVTGSLLAMSS
jgi:hypothetical protein